MILSDLQLRQWGWHGVVPFSHDNVNPASIDLTWSGKYRCSGAGGGWGEPRELSSPIVLSLRRDCLYLFDTAEYVNMPADCCGFLTLKSSMGRAGMNMLHMGFVDPGFQGTLSFEVQAVGPLPLSIEPGQRIVQIVLMRLETEPEKVYNGHYQGDREPTERRS